MAERKPISEEEFASATDIYLVDGKDKIDPKPEKWEDGKYFSSPAADEEKGAAESAAESADGDGGAKAKAEAVVDNVMKLENFLVI